MRALWPMAAQACFCGIVFGFSSSPSRPMPEAIAPEETSTISKPSFFAAETSLARRSKTGWLRVRPLAVRTRLPTLRTTRRTFFRISLRFNGIFLLPVADLPGKRPEELGNPLSGQSGDGVHFLSDPPEISPHPGQPL